MSEKGVVLVRASLYRREARKLREQATAEADDTKRAELLEVSDACERVADRLERIIPKR
jgi:uncharacterized protein Yka (UPF0111/DUF47 family)